MANAPDASVRAMRALCDEINAAINRGELPSDAVTDLKKAIDEARMRIWASMEAAASGDPTWVQQFWIKRAAEVCLLMVRQLESGELDPSSPRTGELRAAAERLASSLAPRHG